MERARELIKMHISSDMRIAVGVSGGMDSVALLQLLLEMDCVRRENITIIHVEHGIRGTSSLNDCEFVKELALNNGLRFEPVRVDVPSLAKSSGLSIEHEARNCRRNAFVNAVLNGADLVLTAHHALDRAETVLMNLFRGSGLNGLKGITVFSDLVDEKYGQVFNDRLFRPLLYCDKSEIELYVKQNSLEYVIDSTNYSSDYSRNFLRNEVLPLVLSKWSGAIKGINSLSDEVENVLIGLNESLDMTLLIKNDNEVKLLDPALRGFKAPYYVFLALKTLFVHKDFERKHIQLVLSLLNAGINGRVDLPQNVVAYRDLDGITLIKDGIKKDKCLKNEGFVLGEVLIGEARVHTDLSEIESFEQFEFHLKNVIGVSGQAGSFKELYFDYDKLPSDAIIRFRQDGDIFKPYLKSEKKLKEYFIEKKIPFRLRDSIPLLVQGEQVLAIVGVEISDTIKVDSRTKKIIRLWHELV